MKKWIIILLVLIGVVVIVAMIVRRDNVAVNVDDINYDDMVDITEDLIMLPAPSVEGSMSFEETVARRRSERSYRGDALNIDQVGQILWAAQGITSEARGYRAVPSAADFSRTAGRYGERATRYVHMEVGHAAQNLNLQAITLGFGAVMVGAFNDSAIKDIMKLPENEDPLYIIPVGRPAK